MSHTRATRGMVAVASAADAHADAAAALVDVAAGLLTPAKRAALDSNSPSSATATTGAAASSGFLPTNSASRKQWDQEQAAPPSTSNHAHATASSNNMHPPALVAAISGAVASESSKNHGFFAAPGSRQQQQPSMAAEGATAAERATQLQWGAPPVNTVPGTTNGSNASSSSSASVLLSMSSLGFGIDPTFATNNATAAAKSALRDALERSAVRLPTAAPLRQSLSIHLKIGVPPQQHQLASGKQEPMQVDTAQLLSLLPPSVHVLPVEVVVGGLLVDHKQSVPVTPMAVADQPPTICTAIACVTLQQSTVAASHGASAVNNNGTTAPMEVDVWPSAAAASAQQSPDSAAKFYNRASAKGASPVAAPSPLNNRPTTAALNRPPSHVHVHRTNSMEMLAMVSGEIRERHLNGDANGKANTRASAAQAVAKAMLPASAALSMRSSAEAAPQQFQADASVSVNSNGSGGNANMTSAMLNNSAYSYKKLAPGMTPKNNKRLFVKHSYKDYSHEDPLPDEQFLIRSQELSTRTPNAAFPLKLHETLTQIELDGYGHIIGWLPHGRSFKIHQQQEFVNVILPKYFVMTKKSSFLRQLNLYNFNRLTGPDSGSYYHEKFLRGLKFLCRRMTRQKVNGNGIRAAGNPDDEPVLSLFPSCPPSHNSTNSCTSSVTHNDNDSHCIAEREQQNRKLVSVAGRVVSVPAASRPQNQEVRPAAIISGGEKESSLVTDENASQGSGGSKGERSRRPSKSTRTEANPTVPSAVQASFPLKLQRILDRAEATGKKDIISWQEHGRAFLVHDPDRFILEVVSKYFSQTKYSSFQRQLHMYNFKRITGLGRDKGAYHHPCFERGNPDLCLSMARTRVNGKGCRRPGDPDNEPDFYEKEYASKVEPGTVIEIPMESPSGADEDSEMQDGCRDEAIIMANTILRD